CIVFILISCFSLHDSVPLPFLHSFPTRRSSDLMFLATLPLAVQRRRILSARSLLSKGLVLGLGASSFDSIDLTFMRNWLNVIDLPWVGDSSISTAYFVPREDIHPSWFSTRAGGPTYRPFPSFTQSTIQSPMRMLRKNFRFPG